MKIVSNLIGIFVVLGLAFLISNNKKIFRGNWY